jgi:hypothetical protein
LRARAGNDPFNRDLADLVGELSTRSVAEPGSRSQEAFHPLASWAANSPERTTTETDA